MEKIENSILTFDHTTKKIEICHVNSKWKNKKNIFDIWNEKIWTFHFLKFEIVYARCLHDLPTVYDTSSI
jgi:hypothetical protein